MSHSTRPDTNKKSMVRRFFGALRGVFAIIGVMVVFSAIIFAFTYRQLTSIKAPPVADQTILTYNFEEDLPEVITRPSLTQPLLGSATTLHEIIHAMDLAAGDDRIKGLIARIKPNGIEVAQLQELRDAIARFRKNGKFAYVFTTSFGDFSNGLNDYYLASAFEQIWLQPIGLVSITGISGQLPFFNDTLQELGISAEMYAREDYKTAVEPITRSKPSAENLQMTTRLLTSIYKTMLTDMADMRGQTPQQMENHINNAPLSDQQALEAGLIDHIGYLDDMVNQAKSNLSEKEQDSAELIDLKAYVHRIAAQDKDTHLKDRFKTEAEKHRKKNAPADRIAVIYGNGAIMADDGSQSRMAPMATGPVMSAEKVTLAINTAREDERVGAIVLRLNSPGGSPTASETIAHAITRAQEEGKPVIVSMSTAAASGGYWVAAGADKIVAQPTTLTGSIGVLAGKITVGDLLDKVGVNIAEVNLGDHAGMWSSVRPFDAEGKAHVNAMLDNIYNSFLTRVSKGRDIPYDRLKSDLAGGRVWTGAEAVQIGLVDQLGGLETAIKLATETMKLEKGKKPQVVQYPQPKTTLELLLDLAVNGAQTQHPLYGMISRITGIDFHAMGMNGQMTYARLPEIK